MTSPTSVVQQFMSAWQREDWEEALSLVQLSRHEQAASSIETWRRSNPRKRQPRPPMTVLEALRARFGGWKLLDFEVREAQWLSEVFVETSVDIAYLDKSTGYRLASTMLVNTICEVQAYQPSIAGTWGVNDLSCARQENLRKVEADA